MAFLFDKIGAYARIDEIKRTFCAAFKARIADSTIQYYRSNKRFEAERAEARKRYNDSIEHIGLANLVKRLEDIDEVYRDIKKRMLNTDDREEYGKLFSRFMALHEHARKETQQPGSVNIFKGDVNIIDNKIQIISGLPHFLQKLLADKRIPSVDEAHRLQKALEDKEITAEEIVCRYVEVSGS